MNEKVKGFLKPLAESLLAVFIGFFLGAIILLAFGYSPFEAYYWLLRGSLGSASGIASTLSYATPIMLTALTFAISARTGIFNIGAEGSVYFGAIAAIIFTNIYGNVLFGLLMGMLVGAMWGLPAAFLKVFRGVHEVISTIMLNWIAWYAVLYLVTGPYANPSDPNKTILVPESARLPLLGGSNLSVGFILAIVASIIVYYILWHTELGFGMRASGMNPKGAEYGGIDPKKAIIWSFVIGGFASGLAGAVEVMGRPPTYAISQGMANINGYGFDGIGVALVGRNHPLGIILAAMFFGMLRAGTTMMQIGAGVPLEIIYVIQGIIVVAVAIPGLIDIFRNLRRVRA